MAYRSPHLDRFLKTIANTTHASILQTGGVGMLTKDDFETTLELGKCLPSSNTPHTEGTSTSSRYARLGRQ